MVFPMLLVKFRRSVPFELMSYEFVFEKTFATRLGSFLRKFIIVLTFEDMLSPTFLYVEDSSLLSVLYVFD